jgi:hypothetical protein
MKTSGLARGSYHGAPSPCGKNKFIERARKRGTAFPFADPQGYNFLVDLQWVKPYQTVSADLSEQLAGA